MNRRNFVLAILGGGGAGMLMGKSLNATSATVEQLPLSNYCRSPRNYSIQLAARRPGELAYQGTHILTYGAFQSLAETYKGTIRVNGGGCDDGISAVKSNATDLGGLCCPVEGTQAKGLHWLQVAWDIKTVVTHPSNPVHNLTLSDLKSIVKGDIANWYELGGIKQPIALVVRRHCPDKFEPVRQLLMGGNQKWSKRSLWVDTDQQLIETVVRYPGSMGVVSNVFSHPLLTSQKFKALNINGYPPKREAVMQLAYPLKGPLNLVFKQERIEAINPFLDYIYSPAGENIISKLLVPVKRDEANKHNELLV